LSAVGIALVFALFGAGAIAGLLLGGRLADRFDPRMTAGIGLAALALALFLLRLVIHAGPLAGLAFGLTSTVAQLFFPAQQAGLVRDFPNGRAAALAWNNSMLFLGILCGSLIGGQALARGGFEADLGVCAVVALCGWALNSSVVPGGRAATPRLRPRRAPPGE
jgi:predicted MFS family arabinose efflux permease